MSGRRERPCMPVHRNLARRAKTECDLPVSRSGGGRRYGDARRHGQEFPSIVEQHDTVAEQAPPLLWMAGHGSCGGPIGCQGVRAPRLMPAWLVSRQPSRSRWRGVMAPPVAEGAVVRAASRCGGHPLIVRPGRCQDVRHLADMRGAITRLGRFPASQTSQPASRRRATWAASWVREEMSSLANTCARWVWTVRREMNSRSPICGLDSPSAKALFR